MSSDGSDTTVTDISAVQRSDLLIATNGLQGPYGLWVDGTTLSYYNVDFKPLLGGSTNSPFPFTRLASIFPSNGSNFYLYHQISETTFVEDLWSSDIGR